MSANYANSAFHPLGVDKWVVSCNQMVAITTLVAPSGERLRVKSGVFAVWKAVWSTPERFSVSFLLWDAIQMSVFTYTFYKMYKHWHTMKKQQQQKVAWLSAEKKNECKKTSDRVLLIVP